MKHWGKELLLNARKCSSVRINNPRNIELFLGSIVQKIDMKAYGKPQIHFFGSDNKCGWSAFQLIETSNISLHACEESGDCYINIFSCRFFDEHIAKAVVQDWFVPESMDMKVIHRDAKYLM
jgi:S-adenosylmethionine/arginine decarboxylase-like enzyme